MRFALHVTLFADVSYSTYSTGATVCTVASSLTPPSFDTTVDFAFDFDFDFDFDFNATVCTVASLDFDMTVCTVVSLDFDWWRRLDGDLTMQWSVWTSTRRTSTSTGAMVCTVASTLILSSFDTTMDFAFGVADTMVCTVVSSSLLTHRGPQL
ncbi:uncharacterized protein EDB93DRAFT_1252681 [Suillus bovinus]|uniref:uncharacterized protein n=1 Tax=Suillus bovinus TaxID=48563 RepID=UPI001B882137|nr:uncharacterized protein EDB93DRAFT_1252681 [Suillus bovinus]KAG2140897.1 hypothetical protein EDB93DRAFT_1252681 [Suillus bovinus]